METADAANKARKGEEGDTSVEAWTVPGRDLGGGLELVEWAMQTPGHTPLKTECNVPSFLSWWLCW